MKCPVCKKSAEWEGNPFRPFCSDRCQLIDLGNWVTGKYAVPVEETPGAERPVDAVSEE